MNSVAIIGAGITGLTAAYKLQQKGIPVTVYESSSHAGGVIQSIRRDSYLAEAGPNTALETAPEIPTLIRDLGLEGRRMYTDPHAEKRYLVRDRKLVPLPGSPLDFLCSSLFSGAAKFRLLKEPFVQPALEVQEENLADFVTRRLGQEFLDYAINPFVAGVYAGDPHHLSVKHAFPKLYNLEQRYGSLIRGQFLGARERKRRAEVSKQNAKKFSFDEGLQVLPQTLQRALEDNVLLDSPVKRMQETGDGWNVTYEGADGPETCHHAAVIYTGPAFRLSQIELQTHRYLNYAGLSQIHYPPVATVVLGFRREDVRHPLDGFGVLVPEVEPFNILGTLFSSSLFPNRAPEGHVLLTTFLGGARAPHIGNSPFETLLNLTLTDMRLLLGVSGEPTFVFHTVFRHAIPQYDVGYGRFKSLMDQIETKAPGLYLAGNYRDGIALGDSIVSGHKVAARVGRFLEERETIATAPNVLAGVA
jgi:oxygen-dependent protoporphyrinogen oxidase